MSGRPWPEQLAFAAFLFCCFQAALLFPIVWLLPGERTNLFTALLAGISLLACVMGVRDPRPRITVAVLLTVVLACLVLLSSWYSARFRVSLFRGVALITTGAGGYWCARLLLSDRRRLSWFAGFCLILLLLLLLAALAGGILGGSVTVLLDDNPHQVVGKLLLLLFAPLVLLRRGDRPGQVAGLMVLFAAGIVLYLSQLRSGILIPLILLLVSLAAAGKLHRSRALLVSLLGGLILLLSFWSFPDRRVQLFDYEPVYYRLESYPFSWHVAKQHPFLGNGLRARRNPYFEEYELKSSLTTRDSFLRSVRRIKTSENIVLTFMADLGFPFTVLYVLSVGGVWVVAVRRTGGLAGARHHWLLVPLGLSFLGSVLHCMTTDDLLVSHVNWFFHVVLGMVSAGAGQEPAPDGGGVTT